MIDKNRIIWHAQNLVRESAYNCFMLSCAENKGEETSRAIGLYKEACSLLRDLAGIDAEENYEEKKEAERFIQATWQVD